MPINPNEVMCKTCRAFHRAIETDIELSGQLEAVERPYGSCVLLEDQVREDEWCGQWVANKWLKWKVEHESMQ